MTMSTDDIARVCHEANRAYCKTLGDDSQPTWEDAPDWQTESAVSGVKFQVEAPWTPEASHEKWCEQKEQEGWTHGLEKNTLLKQHPCLVPWGDLPSDQRRKDVLFQAVCRALLEELP